MKLFLITRTDEIDHDQYVSCIVAAETAETALCIRPDGMKWDEVDDWFPVWAVEKSALQAVEIGTTELQYGLVHVAYNAS